MIRTLRFLAAISFVWLMGCFLLALIGQLFGAPFATFRLVSLLGGELVFAMGILALEVAASRRQFAWLALFALLFALLLALLQVPSLFLVRPSATFLALFEVPLTLLGRYAWVALTPALLPAAAFVYTLLVKDARPLVAGVPNNNAN